MEPSNYNKFLKFKNAGFKANLETGEIFRDGKKIGHLKNGYETITFKDNENKLYSMPSHRFIMLSYVGNVEIPEIDHINGIRTDNRIENLRICDRKTNSQNRTNASGFYFNKCVSKYEARIKVDERNLYLGIFETKELAREAYIIAKKDYHNISLK